MSPPILRSFSAQIIESSPCRDLEFAQSLQPRAKMVAIWCGTAQSYKGQGREPRGSPGRATKATKG